MAFLNCDIPRENIIKYTHLYIERKSGKICIKLGTTGAVKGFLGGRISAFWILHYALLRFYTHEHILLLYLTKTKSILKLYTYNFTSASPYVRACVYVLWLYPTL